MKEMICSKDIYIFTCIYLPTHTLHPYTLNIIWSSRRHLLPIKNRCGNVDQKSTDNQLLCITHLHSMEVAWEWIIQSCLKDKPQ